MSQELAKITPIHLRIERAREKEDIDKVFSILDQCSRYLLAKGIDYWKNSYPYEEVLEMATKCDTKLAYENDVLVGTFTLLNKPKKNLREIWESIDRSRSKNISSPLYGMALGVLPEMQNKGIGRTLCKI